MTVPANQGAAQSAWTDPTTRSTVRSAWWRAVATVVVGCVLMGAAGAMGAVATRHGDELRATGGQVDGVVAASGMVGARFRRSETTYRYVVDGRTYERTAQGELGLEDGQVVRVFYDLDDPGDATLADEDPQPFWTWVLMIAAMCSSLLLVPVGVVRAVGALRRRRILRRAPWTEAWYQPAPRGRSVVLLPDPRIPPGTLPTLWVSQRRWARLGGHGGRAVRLRVAYAGSRAVVTRPGSANTLEPATCSTWVPAP